MIMALWLFHRHYSHDHGHLVSCVAMRAQQGSGPPAPGDRGSPGPAQTRYVVYMWIGGPARKHGVPHADIWHGIRNATCKIDMGDDLTMLIGPSRDGASLESGVLGLDSGDPVIIHAMALRAKFYRFLG
jgi:hypothetical protein